MIYANTLREGCPVSLFSPEQQDVIVKLFLAFNEYYPAPVLENRVALFKKFLDKTYFAWIGEFGDVLLWNWIFIVAVSVLMVRCKGC
jgi:Protein of unknown function (DUF3500)